MCHAKKDIPCWLQIIAMLGTATAMYLITTHPKQFFKMMDELAKCHAKNSLESVNAEEKSKGATSKTAQNVERKRNEKREKTER